MPLLKSASTTVEALGRGVLAVQQARRRGDDPRLEERWIEISPRRAPADLAALVKADLMARFACGERPAVAEYLEKFPAIRAERDRVVSLVYEEYCLREERGERLDPDSFCGRYEPWRDSLASQLQYHRALSQVAGVAPPAPKFPEPGERFLWFRLDSVLGTGGAGRVYLALDEELGGREVALKISPDRGGEPSIQGRLDHAHIVPVLSVAREPESGLRGLCMPYRPGRPLDDVTRRAFEGGRRPRRARDLVDAARPEGEPPGSKPPAWAGFPIRGSYAEAVAWVVAALADALAHAHARDVCHRDVKPANVLITLRDGPQLLDFNLAHDPHAAEQAEAALRGGTLPYMAPEQLEAFLDPDCWGDVGPSADIYALGLLLREMLTGKRPEAPDPELPLPRAVNDLLDLRDYPPTPLRQLVPGIPRALDAIASKCLAPEPKDRYASAAYLAEDLRLFLAHTPPRHADHAFDAETAVHWVARHRRKLLIANGVLATVAVALLVVRPILATVCSTICSGKLDMALKASEEKPPRFEEALKLVRDAERFDPGNPRIFQVEGQIAYKMKRLVLSRVLFTRAIDAAKARNGGPADEKRIVDALVCRAAVEIRDGLSRQGNATMALNWAAYKSSETLFLNGLQDLAVARQSRWAGSIEGLPLRIENQTATAYMGISSVAHSVDKYSKEIECLSRSEKASRRALELDENDEASRKRLDDIVSRRKSAIVLRDTIHFIRDRLTVLSSRWMAAIKTLQADTPKTTKLDR